MSISVEVKGDLERAIRVLKKKMQSEGVQKDLKRRRSYEKPSVKREMEKAYGYAKEAQIQRPVGVNGQRGYEREGKDV